jgi:predicted ATPase/DNA-binding NarL/FixJ family response regulator
MVRQSNLPARRRRLIGRAGALDSVRERVLHGDRRLVTLTGAAGAGKTTLALEVARQVQPLMPDGAWFVDLRLARESEEIALAIAAALGIADQARPPLDAVADHLAARQTLLVLDNGEHLLEPLGATIDVLLDRSADLRLLVTSRAPLRVRDESVVVVPPFDIPPPDVVDVARLADVEAVQLFVERATAVDPGFSLDATTAPAVASICRRLDGLPLAIELAAASASALTAAEIDQRLAVPGARQGTIDATLDWSHDLLSPAAQALLRRLAVFAGGWSLATAGPVGSLGRDPEAVVEQLGELVDHSLVVRDTIGDQSRYRMLAPIAEYAARRLEASGERVEAGIAHATTFLAASTLRYGEVGQCLPEDIDRLATEHENLLAAIRFAEQIDDLPLRLGLTLNLIPLWRVRGHLHLALRHLGSALTATAEGTAERGSIHGLLAEFLNVSGDDDAAERHGRAGEAIFVALGNPVGRRVMIAQQGLAAAARGDVSAALEAFRRARPLLDVVPSEVSFAYWEAGVGRFELELGDLDAAETHLRSADERFRRVPSWYHGRVLAMLATLAHRRGDPARAVALAAEGLESLRRYGATVEVIACLGDVARLAIEQGHHRRAATLLAAATGLRDATGTAASVPAQAQRAADIEAARAALSTADFEAAWLAGIEMTLDQAVAAASPTGAAPTVSAGAARPRGSLLTPREREIAELVALGLSNREIADRLVIAPGTVKIHVERILGKLGRTSRVQIATWAMEDRLASETSERVAG